MEWDVNLIFVILLLFPPKRFYHNIFFFWNFRLLIMYKRFYNMDLMYLSASVPPAFSSVPRISMQVQ